MSNEAGKGDSPRPLSVDHQTFGSNWERTFSKAELDTCAYSGLPAVDKYKDNENEHTTTVGKN